MKTEGLSAGRNAGKGTEKETGGQARKVLGIDLGLIAYPLAIIVAWEAAYALFDLFFPPGSGNLHLTVMFFVCEFAIILALPMYIAASLSKKKGMGLGAVSAHYLAFFAVFAALGLLSSLALGVSHSSDLVYSLVMFAALDAVKLLIGFAGVFCGFYLQGLLKPASWESYRSSILYLSAAIIIASLTFSYAAGTALSGSISSASSPDYSDSAANCTAGSWSMMSFFGASLNVTVQGLGEYRGRQSCHSNGTSALFGDNVTYDFYSVTADDYCTLVTTEAPNGTTVKESCKGEWPGYVPSGN